MTIEEINALIFEDYIEAMAIRIWQRMDPLPSEQPEFTTPELEAEFGDYRQELISEENERLRKLDLTNRFNDLDDMRGAFHSIYEAPNPALWLENNLLIQDPSQAEAAMQALEAKSQELKTENDLKVASDNKKQGGKFVRMVCGEILDLVAGNNLEKSLTV